MSFILLWGSLLKAQEKNIFDAGGSISVTQQMNFRSGEALLNTYLNGQLNVSVKGYEMPFSFSYSNQNLSLSHPFNRFSFNPRIKNTQFYLGYANMSFSKSTVDGITFLGVGSTAELSSNFSLKSFVGRLRKENPYDSLLKMPVFRRLGSGLQLEYRKGKTQISTSFFGAGDSSPQGFSPENLSLPRREFNIAGGIDIKTHLWKSLMADLSLSGSIFPENFNSLSNSSVYLSIASRLSFTQKWYSIGLGYVRTDPNYRTMGAFFFNNDLESYKADFRADIPGTSFKFALEGGVQGNDLDNEKVTSRRQLAGSAKMQGILFKTLNINLSVSNFRTYSLFKNPLLEEPHQGNLPLTDTLRFVQVSSRQNLSLSYKSQRESRLNYRLNLSNQTIAENGGRYAFRNANFGLSGKTSRDFSYNFRINVAMKERDVIAGPSVSLSKSFNKFMLSLRSAATGNWEMDRLRISNRVMARYKINDFAQSGISVMNSLGRSTSTFHINANLNLTF